MFCTNIYQHSAFAQGDDLHLIGRFMMRETLFRGIRSEEELAYVLTAYDISTDWPEGSGISYTHHFFPRAFEIGFRLTDLAATLWSIYQALAPPKLQPHLNVAMEHVAKPVESLFRNHGGSAISVEFSRDALIEAVESARYSAYMQALSLMPLGVRHDS